MLFMARRAAVVKKDECDSLFFVGARGKTALPILPLSTPKASENDENKMLNRALYDSLASVC